MKKIITVNEVSVFILIFLLISGFSFIPFNCGFLNPVSRAMADFEIYDIVFSRIMEEQDPDTNIVIVNLGDLNRYQLSELINIINYYEPKVVGIDAFFERDKDLLEDTALALALSNCKNLVMVSKLDSFDFEKEEYSYIKLSIDKFSRYSKAGYANLPNPDSGNYSTIRKFAPFAKALNSYAPSFASTITKIYDPGAYNVLKERENEYETINYRGNYNKFYFVDVDEAFSESADLSFIKNKIVLIGYLGSSIQDKSFEDIFFTPLNDKYAGKSFPDMYGIVIHANIISMILNGNYINELPFLVMLSMTLLLVILNIKIIFYFKSKFKYWSSAMIKGFILFYTVLNLYISVEMLHYFDYKINLTITLAAIALTTTSIEFHQNVISNLLKKIKKKKG